LQDDYVKFLRFAQDKMQREEEGIVGVITNHSYLDNPTFRGMRQSLTETFDQIYILDLHGSTKPKELVPEGVENENVFDIQKGVAVALFVKRPGVPKGVWYADVWGSRQQKYQTAANASFNSVAWERVECFSPYYMFKPLDWTHWPEYEPGWPVADVLNPTGDKRQIFELNVLGFQTHRDHFAIALDRSRIEERVQAMLDPSLSDRELSETFKISDNRDWKLAGARKELRVKANPMESIIHCAYRPFDQPFCYFGEEFMDYPRRELVEHVAGRNNIQLLISRQIGIAEWRHAYAALEPAESCCISDGSTEQNYCFPVHLYPGGKTQAENLSAAFRARLDGKYEHHFGAEQVAGYVYAILSSPTYRRRYLDFLRIDFPRIPFAESAVDFEKLSALGWALVEAHLLRKVKRRGLGKYQGNKQGQDENRVVAVRYVEAEEAAYINDAQRFAPIPPEVWNFRIGGYQVLDKYLKSRKGRVLSLDEQEHVPKVADALAFTIEQMSTIDEAYKAAFPEQT
jgi:predicted helicase